MKSKTLNPVVWDAKNKLYPAIRERLLKIANKFIEGIEAPIKIVNIFLTGSLCSYEWSADSDWDLHIIVLPKNDYCGTDTLADYFDSKSKIFNKDHDIFIKGYPVEVNMKEKESVFKNKAIYDLQEDRWVQKPTHPDIFLNNPKVVEMAEDYQNRINKIVNHNGTLEDIKDLRDEIKGLRQKGLEENGEFSVGNLVFKTLRHSGYIQKLYNYKAKIQDEELSLENFKSYFNSL